MTPERRKQIESFAKQWREMKMVPLYMDVLDELLSEVDRLEGEIARYREEPNAKMLCKIHSKIPADPNGFIVTYEQLDAALEAYRSAVK